MDTLERKTPDETRPRVQSAARAVAILVAVAQSESGLTTKEISHQVGIGRQATYHLLHTLVGAGMMTRSDRNRYVLGLRVGTLATGFARQLAPSERLAPLVRDLARTTSETCYASGWSANEIAVFTVAHGSNPVLAAEVAQGHVGDAHARASGKLLLAYASSEIRDEYLSAHPLTQVTSRTKTNKTELKRELETIRSQGYAEDWEEFATGLCCLSVPLDSGFSPFVISLSAPLDRFESRRDDYLSALLEAA